MAPKREIKTEKDDVSEPDAKRPMLLDKMVKQEDDEHPHAFTRLPPEILLDIFDYLKPEDDCMKKLSEVCKKFYNLCALRLRVLHINFNLLHLPTMNLPVIRRGYAEIRMFGAEIDYHREEIRKILESSRETASKLVINGVKSGESLIKMRFLMFILRSLPNLEEVEITKVNGLIPQFWWKAIQDNENPTLANLRKLTMTNIPVVICLAFEEAENIEELKLDITSFKEEYYVGFYFLVIQQKKLRLLHLDANVTNLTNQWRFPEAALGGNNFDKLLRNFPKLEHIKLAASHSNKTPAAARRITQASLMAGFPVKSVKTIELLRSCCNGPFDIDQIRMKFPSLESFKSSELNWSITGEF